MRSQAEIWPNIADIHNFQQNVVARHVPPIQANLEMIWREAW